MDFAGDLDMGGILGITWVARNPCGVLVGPIGWGQYGTLHQFVPDEFLAWLAALWSTVRLYDQTNRALPAIGGLARGARVCSRLA